MEIAGHYINSNRYKMQGASRLLSLAARRGKKAVGSLLIDDGFDETR